MSWVAHETQVPDEDGDVFAQDATVHPAFQQSLAVASDIYEKLFDGFFKGQLFARWVHYKDFWQLNVVGGPGTGKTTFAALAVKYICKVHAELLGRNMHLAAVFIEDGCIENELAFLEDLLHSMYKQLTPASPLVRPSTRTRYGAYSDARHKGRRASQRVSLIAQALRYRVTEISEAGRAFLVIDHLDQCSPSLKELVQRELLTLQEVGLKILVTSRLPRHEEALDRWCDSPDHRQGGPLNLYWHCSNCKEDICDVCKGDQIFCATCGPANIWEEPEQYTLFIDEISEKLMHSFLVWDLEREHGDLGFETLSNPSEPPLSSFGLAFRTMNHGTTGLDWIHKIIRYVDGSILQAKLALDRIHNSNSPDAVDLDPKRLPANVQAHFNTAIRVIEQQSTDHNALALKSIAAIGKEGETIQGLILSRLANLLRERPHRAGPKTFPPRSPEDIVHAANGYLRLIPPQFDGEEYTIASFHRLFWVFANDEYNEELVMAYSQLRTSKVPRSFTFQSPVPPSLPAYQSASPSRRESSALTRSQTFISSADLVASPPAGLGVFDFASLKR